MIPIPIPLLWLIRPRLYKVEVAAIRDASSVYEICLFDVLEQKTLLRTSFYIPPLPGPEISNILSLVMTELRNFQLRKRFYPTELTARFNYTSSK